MMRGLRAGLIGGVATVAATYLAAPLTGVRPLPDLLQERCSDSSRARSMSALTAVEAGRLPRSCLPCPS